MLRQSLDDAVSVCAAAGAMLARTAVSIADAITKLGSRIAVSIEHVDAQHIAHNRPCGEPSGTADLHSTAEEHRSFGHSRSGPDPERFVASTYCPQYLRERS